jgi:hypothetical protein
VKALVVKSLTELSSSIDRVALELSEKDVTEPDYS